MDSRVGDYKKSNLLLFCLICICTTLFIGLDLWYLTHSIKGIAIPPLILTLLSVKIAIELSCSFYVIAFLCITISYLFMRNHPKRFNLTNNNEYPPIAVLYLCCNDLDLDSLTSLCKLDYPGKMTLFVHDDSLDAEVNESVDCHISKLVQQSRQDIRILRREDKSGGKPGALNYLLSQIKNDYPYFVICDNDSIVLQPDCLKQTVSLFQDPSIAIVQFRNLGYLDKNDGAMNRVIYRAVDVFHVFIHVLSRYGWQPFFGHNAILNTKYVLDVGGFTPGAFADDFDLTLRLNFKGKRVIYLPEVEFGEKHPPSYKAFRKRSHKWAYGCAQVLDKYAWQVLGTNKLTLTEKWGFFQLSFFYVFQVILVLYLFLTYILLPYLIGKFEFNFFTSFLSGLMMVLFIYCPLLAYFIKERKWKGMISLTVLCGLVYGSTDFISAKGVWDHVRKKTMAWIPTNYNPVKTNRIPYSAFLEFLFGFVIIAIPFWKAPQLLAMPTTYLFAFKFICSPFLFLAYKTGG